MLPGDLTQTGLAKQFGFPVPSAFVVFVNDLNRLGKGDWKELFTELTGEYVAGDEMRYQSTPPEMCPIATMRVDGVHYGYVIHAPELPAGDYPIGHYCPMDSGGVILVGKNTREAIENLISFRLGQLVLENPKAVLQLARRLGLSPSPKKWRRKYGKDGNGVPITPRVPHNWTYTASEDGIGVLAPTKLFGTRRQGIRALDDFFEEADRAFVRGFFATALLYLRDAYWLWWSGGGRAAREVCLRLVRVYQALDRPFLVEVVQRRIKKFSTRKPGQP